jgi:hypothetical protein
MLYEVKEGFTMRFFCGLVGRVIIVCCLAGCNVNLNKSVTIGDGEVIRKSQNAINGNITVGSGCRVLGSCRSVNGSIQVGSGSYVQKLQSVNGKIDLDEKVFVDGNIESVNGLVSSKSGVEIQGELKVVNGSVDLYHTVVQSNVCTYNGSVTFKDSTVIHGDVIVKRTRGNSSKRSPLKVIIMGASVVMGDVVNEERGRIVEVYFSGGGEVWGHLQNVEVIQK